MATKITEPPQATEMEYFFGGGSDMCYLKEEADAYIRQLKRALWLARADRAYEKFTHLLHLKGEYKTDGYNTDIMTWHDVYNKCRAKADEYKEG